MIYFISDAHLGSRLVNDPYGHEMRLVRWLDKVKSDAKADIICWVICLIFGLSTKQSCLKVLSVF